MTSTKKIIGVWPDGDEWIVSRDTVSAEYSDENNMGAIYTVTEYVCETREEAIEQALLISDSLPIYEQDARGITSRVRP
jgi:hypothetical protein